VKSEEERALDIAEDALDQRKVGLTQGMHEEARLLNHVCQVRASQSEL
jgi:hypothetical protein